MLGAFGAHALKSKITSDQLQVFETGVRYQFYHSLALLVVGLISLKFEHGGIRMAAWLFMAGIVLFSGSLYLLSNREWLGIEGWKSILGPVTPLGGLCFIAGWISLAWAAFRSNQL